MDQYTYQFTADSNGSGISQRREGRFSKVGSTEVKSQRQSGIEWTKGTVMFVLRMLMGKWREVKLVR